ncbi:HEAT repeat domain-containing protein [Schlesneria sp.]|uniref:HEAT repeat domain-containing protein n=1 Tax=Schlesneria sp. TaxID=2762018 RepID=UPI002F230605
MVRPLPMRSAAHVMTLAFVVACLAASCLVTFAQSSPLDALRESDPALSYPVAQYAMDPALKQLWLSALDSPEVDMQRMAAETIARSQEVNSSNLVEAVPSLERILEAKASHPAARFAAARALIVLDSRDSSGKLLEASKSYGSDLRLLIEPALAEWDYEPARAVWLGRLSEQASRRRELILAVRGLGVVRERKALNPLLEIINDSRRHPDERFEAATAVGQISATGLETQAEKLARSPGTPTSLNRLCAIQMLLTHETAAAAQLLSEWANDDEPLIAATAMRRLNALDSALMLSLAESALKHPDARIRSEGIESCIMHPTTDKTAALGRLLADPDPALREKTREGLLRLSSVAELKPVVNDVVKGHLQSDDWKGQEQAAILAGGIDLEEVANRLVELLESPRVEVKSASAWALRKVAVKETIPAILQIAKNQTELRKSGAGTVVDEQVAHLLETLGVLKATEAIPLLKEYIPKHYPMGVQSRSAAIWALGVMPREEADAELEDALMDRILDFADRPPEMPEVKQMSAISLARMKSTSQAERLRGLAVNVPLSVELGVALRWAVKELTGEELPPPTPVPVPAEDWFLVPLQ